MSSQLGQCARAVCCDRGLVRFAGLRLADFCADQQYENLVHGFFHDRRRNHYLVTRARIEESLRTLSNSGRLGKDGLRLPPPPPELEGLRRRAWPAQTYTVLKEVTPEGAGRPYPCQHTLGDSPPRVSGLVFLRSVRTDAGGLKRPGTC